MRACLLPILAALSLLAAAGECSGDATPVAFGAGAVWVANTGDGTVSRIDLETAEVVKTIPVGTVSDLIKADVLFWGSLMASAVLGSVPVAIIYSFFVEHYVAGLTAGSVKG